MANKRLKLDSKWPVGVFDSGLGGLTVLDAIKKTLPEEDLLYVADNKFLPYGGRSIDEITTRTNTIARFLTAYPVKALVVACNTATAASIKSLRHDFDLPIIGVEPGIKPACQVSQSGKIGVLATQGTLSSEKYENLKNLHGKDVQVFEQACVGLVEEIENEYPNFSQTKILLKTYLDLFKSKSVDTIVLGCTHYPLIEKLIHDEMHSVVTINTGSAIARQLKLRLKQLELLNSGNFSPLYRILASQANQAFQDKVSRLIPSKTENPVMQLPVHYC